jgi:hypothetical protein
VTARPGQGQVLELELELRVSCATASEEGWPFAGRVEPSWPLVRTSSVGVAGVDAHAGSIGGCLQGISINQLQRTHHQRENKCCPVCPSRRGQLAVDVSTNYNVSAYPRCRIVFILQQ